MSDISFLRSPRWLLAIVLAGAAIVVFVSLGGWQLQRLDERRELNTTVAARTALAPTDLDRLLGEAGGDLELMVWRRVVIDGTYVTAEEVVVEGRSHKAIAGSNVLTPLRWERGRAVVVNRGWIPVTADPASVPPVADEVQVTGVLRRGEGAGLLGGGGSGATDRLGRIDLDRIDAQTADAVLPLYLQLEAQRPPQAAPEAVPLPVLGDGPHLSYAIQWFFFALVVAIGFPVLVWRTARTSAATPGIPSTPSSAPSTRPGPPET